MRLSSAWRLCCANMMLLAMAGLTSCAQAKDNPVNDSQTKNAQAKDTVEITAVGDVMIGSAFPSKDFLPKDDAKSSFARVASYLKGDVVFGNLEGALLDAGSSGKCEGSAPGRCFAFRMPERYAAILKQAGFTLMGTANNHANDFGEAGRAATARVLNRVGILNAGPVERKTALFTKNGVRYGFAAFSPNSSMMSINDIAQAQQVVRGLVAKSDIVIIAFHGGAEGESHTHVPRKNEFFYGENRGNVHQFAHAMIDAGADLILGSGPHVTRAVELYKNKFIAYSLGNFNTYGQFNLKGVNGIAPLLKVRLTHNGDFVSGNVVSIKQTKEAGLMVDNSGGALQQLQSLTKADFPETPLRFVGNRIEKR